MSAESIASRFDNRPGHKLIAFGPVGLPVFRLTTISLCIATKPLDPIEEFVLRSVEAGVESIGEISGFLGLDRSVIDATLVELSRAECVRIATAQSTSDRTIELTPKGRDTATSLEQETPLEQTVVFLVDGLTRQPSFHPQIGRAHV